MLALCNEPSSVGKVLADASQGTLSFIGFRGVGSERRSEISFVYLEIVLS